MKTIIKYQADDGTEWPEAEAAHKRDRLIAAVNEEQPYYAANPGAGDQVEWQEGAMP